MAAEGVSRMKIPIAQIHLDEENHREAAGSDLDGLKSSMDLNGMLSAVGVEPYEGKGFKYTLIYGFRRVAVAKMLGWTEIEATLKDAASTPAERHAIRAVENLDRLQLNPLEESLAVSRLVGALEEEVPGEGVALAAERLGRSRAWVNARVFVNRFGPKAKKLIAEGRLPLAQAREIAKIGDDKRRDWLAEHCAGDEWKMPRDIRSVHHFVQQETNRLDKVPWVLGVAFAGKPACDACEHNSANATALFDGEELPEIATCLRPSCFAAKSTAAESSIARAIEKAATALTINGRAPESVRLTDVEGMVPKAVKPLTFAARARSQITPRKSNNGAALPPKVVKKQLSAFERAKARAEVVSENREDATKTAVCDRMRNDPAFFVILAVVGHLDLPSRWEDASNKDTEKFFASGEWQLAIDAVKAGVTGPLVEIAKLCDRKNIHLYDLGILGDANFEVFEQIAEAAGIELPPRPDLDALVQEENAKDKATKVNPTTKKKTTKEPKETVAEPGAVADVENHALILKMEKAAESAIADARVSAEHTGTAGWQKLYGEHKRKGRETRARIADEMRSHASQLTQSGWSEDTEKEVKGCAKESAELRAAEEAFYRETVSPVVGPVNRLQTLLDNYRDQARGVEASSPLFSGELMKAMNAAILKLPRVSWDEKAGVVTVEGGAG